jgi:hypothetical protein
MRRVELSDVEAFLAQDPTLAKRLGSGVTPDDVTFWANWIIAKSLALKDQEPPSDQVSLAAVRKLLPPMAKCAWEIAGLLKSVRKRPTKERRRALHTVRHRNIWDG